MCIRDRYQRRVHGKRLIKLGADVNNEDNNGQNALFYAAREGKADICQLLIENGIFVNKQDSKKQTALYMARKNSRADAIKVLIANGASLGKETLAEEAKERSGKRGESESKREAADVNVTKRYVLCCYINGEWRPLTPREVQEYLRDNPKEANYLQDKEYLESLKAVSLPLPTKLYYHWDIAATKIMNHMWRAQGGRKFHSPVDSSALNAPDYYSIIKNPIDFGTIKNKLKEMMYTSYEEFVSDMKRVFSNCILYNGENSKLADIARNLRAEFAKQCQIYSLRTYRE
eukprot:TRINITY_DN15767_c0_g4_i2.p1 TRINITY_DN15767_c0_g4~~TRINITY_DN15767_c0_g4_i2.p1  ORF type:complete len:305 (+),score=68.76 TRINITY_DN15767_c0_g4_i2:53-916(+)